MTTKQLFNRFLIQLNLISTNYFLREVVDNGAEVQKLANEGTLAIEELENLMNSWRDDTFLQAKKEAELLFTDEQMAALAAIKKSLREKEKRIEKIQLNLVELDKTRQHLEKKLAAEDNENIGSQQLALISQEFWLQLAIWRKRNLDERKTALINLVEKLKKENHSNLDDLSPETMASIQDTKQETNNNIAIAGV